MKYLEKHPLKTGAAGDLRETPDFKLHEHLRRL